MERRQYTAEFKKQAVELSETTDKTVAQIARELGIRPKLLYKWRQDRLELGAAAFPGHGKQPASEAEFTALRQELERTRQERDILKKALAIFSQTW